MSRETDKSSSKQRITIVIMAVLMVVGFSAAGYLYWQNRSLQNDPTTSQQAADNKAKVLKDKVGKLISVPADEIPVVATVTDKEKLKEQPFFADAQNDDYILMFPQAKKAMIYREKENRLINVGPIAITSDTATEGTQTQN